MGLIPECLATHGHTRNCAGPVDRVGTLRRGPGRCAENDGRAAMLVLSEKPAGGAGACQGKRCRHDLVGAWTRGPPSPKY
jgi:hypothetical protein